MDAHVAGCPECYQVFAETLQFCLSDGKGVTRAGAEVTVLSAFRRRPTFKIAAGLSMAAMLAVALGLWFSRAGSGRAPAPLVAQLAQAMGDRRLVEPRLTGGFRHGRLVTLRAGDTPQGLDAQPAAVLAAVARIREQAEGDTSPEALGALGITYLVSGDPSAAVKALEGASAQEPGNARLLSDLAAAYLVRASRLDEPADVPKALEAAERAIALEDAPQEAYFNRALALEALHLVDAARKAWEGYLQRDSASGWADEARQHLEALPQPRPSSLEEGKARVRAALGEGAAATDRLADEAPQLLRDHLEDELLPAWAEAYLVGHPDASVHRERARLLGDALLRSTRDAMAKDTALALAEPLPTAASRDPLRAQALGYRAFREAKRLTARQVPSCAQNRDAVRDLEAGGSPYAARARLQVVITCLFPSQHGPALAELARLESAAEADRHLQLLGRVHWVQGLIHAHRGQLTESLKRYRSAYADFETSRSPESQAVALALLAENLQLLGESRGAWRERQRSFALLEHVRDAPRRHGILADAGLACVEGRMPRVALHYGNALVDSALGSSLAAVISDALVRRADIHHWLGAEDRAAADVMESRRWIPRIGDEALAAKQQAEADATEGEILIRPQPEQAARALERSLAYFRVTTPARVPALQLLLARAHLGRGLDEAAERELATGIEAMEQGRISLRDAALQVSFFELALPLFDDMVRFQVTNRQDPRRALAFVERGRARQLVDSLAGAAVKPFDPVGLQRALPEGLALVYYVPLDDRLLAWALTREDFHFIERPLSAAALSRMVAAHRTAIEGRAPLDAVQRTGARLHDELVRPFIPFLAAQRALVFVPDGVLQSVAFSGLWNRQTGRYLVEDHILGLAPSGTVFVRASTVAARPREAAPGALIVGNPQLDRRLWDAANLPGAEAEASEIAGLYPRAELLTGSGATKAAFLERVRVSQVVHYAGHAAANAADPAAARLVFAADPRTGDSGALYLHQLDHRGFPRTRVVVLAACRTAAGAVSRVEGPLSLGRPFLAAGVPDVVASLWDIDDAVSRRFFVGFHRALLAEGDPFLALRRAQLALLHGDNLSLAHPASWAVFICMGGLDPHSLSNGEMS
jgi:CHAT domain-containing protein